MNQIKKIAFLVSCASVLQITETLIPHPLPWFRLGLANMITLVALVNIGFRACIEIAVLRTIISSFILGNFLSPYFILSFSGAIISSLVMGFFYKLSILTLNYRIYFSLVGISVLGAVTHNLVQIHLVYLLLIKHEGIFLLIPWLGISAVIMGWITGLVASEVCQRLENLSDVKFFKESKIASISSFKLIEYVQLNSPIHLLSSEIKIISILILSLIILFSNNLLCYIFLLLFLFSINYLSRIPLLILFSGVKKLYPFIFFSFLMLIFFNTKGEILLDFSLLKITKEGLFSGIIFIFKIILLMLNVSLLVRTTAPKELISGLNKILIPLRIFGISPERTGEILMLSWTSIPVLYNEIHNLIHNKELFQSGKRRFKNIIFFISNIIVVLYQRTYYEKN